MPAMFMCAFFLSMNHIWPLSMTDAAWMMRRSPRQCSTGVPILLRKEAERIWEDLALGWKQHLFPSAVSWRLSVKMGLIMLDADGILTLWTAQANGLSLCWMKKRFGSWSASILYRLFRLALWFFGRTLTGCKKARSISSTVWEIKWRRLENTFLLYITDIYQVNLA